MAGGNGNQAPGGGMPMLNYVGSAAHARGLADDAMEEGYAQGHAAGYAAGHADAIEAGKQVIAEEAASWGQKRKEWEAYARGLYEEKEQLKRQQAEQAQLIKQLKDAQKRSERTIASLKNDVVTVQSKAKSDLSDLRARSNEKIEAAGSSIRRLNQKLSESVKKINAVNAEVKDLRSCNNELKNTLCEAEAEKAALEAELKRAID